MWLNDTEPAWCFEFGSLSFGVDIVGSSVRGLSCAMTGGVDVFGCGGNTDFPASMGFSVLGLGVSVSVLGWQARSVFKIS